MIGMSFASFLVLLIISVIVAAILHYAVGYRVLKGGDGFCAKWVLAWIGGWLGSPVLGHWWASVSIGSVYIIPAIIGAFISGFLATSCLKSASQVFIRESRPLDSGVERMRAA
jgi:uncharacterized membrane protein YeaQ/YmgE (transglycosylase-associated protein family)